MNKPISIPKIAALKTSAVTKVSVVAEFAVCWSTPDLKKVQRRVTNAQNRKDIHGNEAG